jgi:hypothetical protein
LIYEEHTAGQYVVGIMKKERSETINERQFTVLCIIMYSIYKYVPCARDRATPPHATATALIVDVVAQHYYAAYLHDETDDVTDDVTDDTVMFWELKCTADSESIVPSTPTAAATACEYNVSSDLPKSWPCTVVCTGRVLRAIGNAIRSFQLCVLLAGVLWYWILFCPQP